MSREPWTFEDLDLEPEQTWVIHDPNLARVVAVFYDGAQAQRYLDWCNADQAERRSGGGGT